MRNIRALAANAIYPLLMHTGSLNQSLVNALDSCPEKDRPLLQQLCYGTARNFPRLLCIADSLMDRPLRERDNDVLAVLLVGLYQLMDMRIPVHAAISETVDAVHQLDRGSLSGLVNAVLRRFDREKEDILDALYDDITYHYNHPEWFIQKLKANWPEFWQTILEENNHQAPLTLRINRQHVSRETYHHMLQEAGHGSELTRWSEDGIVLDEPCDVHILPHFSDGWVSVQDEAAQIAAQLVNPSPGERILDACAAPGGKLCHLLEQASVYESNDITIDALEIDRRRAKRITENLDRLSQTCNLMVGDASETDWWNQDPYDKMLVDAPCSATGVIRRNPDIKILRTGEAIHQLSAIQMAILKNLWPMLKKGGTLVYATCSIFSQENDKLIKRFIAETEDAEHQPISAEWGIERPYGRQLFPQRNGHDGFYYAVIKKIG
ncbi:16S rRNA (cytosine(967)-C(5))-methyltransferase RsmB [Neptunomonas phycophila]|uniref:16S rRNA (cytosine(967)-C(5))-methyltransferase RsmB n=1 Tax=Neptunomonas phycophila TaxID=1572645 RepID=UPI0026E2D70F|nr:16S rRNA (cytosine(967)-C(5))-methyltransferase RsmB [Neptunomonas phycophila]MDO6469201.1 16S rRNA (cytosine(967)-C(5))-methyltransferase RsmB [Neptunomonas phycophila]